MPVWAASRTASNWLQQATVAKVLVGGAKYLRAPTRAWVLAAEAVAAEDDVLAPDETPTTPSGSGVVVVVVDVCPIERVTSANASTIWRFIICIGMPAAARHDVPQWLSKARTVVCSTQHRCIGR